VSNAHTTIMIPHDSDGFTSLTCPQCAGFFKVRPNSPNPTKVCPYCGHREADTEPFFGPELHEYVRVQGQNAALDLLKSNPVLGKAVTAKPAPLPPRPPEPDSSGMASTTFTCCSEVVRHDGTRTELYCPSCGTKQSV
jgi:hypothetical protein